MGIIGCSGPTCCKKSDDDGELNNQADNTGASSKQKTGTNPFSIDRDKDSDKFHFDTDFTNRKLFESIKSSYVETEVTESDKSNNFITSTNLFLLN